MKNLGEIEVEIERLAATIAADQSMLPTYGYSDGSERPHIEVDARGYHYVTAERGHEFDRWTTSELDTLLYAVFRSVTFDMASRYELHHRVAGRDSRRLLFQRQTELISVLSPSWAERVSTEKAKLLKIFPFDDYSGERAALTKRLRDQGHAANEAWRIACEKYPEPGNGTLEDGRRLQLELRKTDAAE